MRHARHVLMPALALCCSGVRHDELRALLGAYAAGDLPAPLAEAVRAHLAAGCIECLDDVFRRPVGLPRHPPLNATAVDLPRPTITPVPGRAGRGVTLAITVPALALAAFAAWTIWDLRVRESARADEAARTAARLGEAEAARGTLAARVDRLEGELQSARDEAARQSEAARVNGELATALSRDLEAAQDRIGSLARGVQRRDGEIDRLLSGAEERHALRDLLATPGVEMLRLHPVAPFQEGRGHVLWHPAREDVVLYAFDLPTPPPDTRYRVRLTLDDNHDQPGPTFTPGPRGDVVLPLKLGVPAARCRAVEILLDPGAKPVLAARRDGAS
jgi:hypothetical protein